MEIKTAREILEENHINEGFKLDDQCTYDISVDSMIEFAKLHVEAALKTASKVDIKVEKRSVYGKYRKWQKVKEGEEFDLFDFEMQSSPDRKSILNSYNLDTIK